MYSTVLVTFRTKAYANITMFGEVAVRLLRLMGHTGTVPSAIRPEDIPDALRRLKAGIAAAEAAAVPEEPSEARQESGDSEEPRVSLKQRAFPLIQLLEAAERENVPVMWDS